MDAAKKKKKQPATKEVNKDGKVKGPGRKLIKNRKDRRRELRKADRKQIKVKIREEKKKLESELEMANK